MSRWLIMLVVLVYPVAAAAAAHQEGTNPDAQHGAPTADDDGTGGETGTEPSGTTPTPSGAPGQASAATAPRCDRDVDADLLTIQDRLIKGRLDPARAYIEGLIQCQEGRDEPQVFLYLAQIEELDGHLNGAFRALELAQAVAGRMGHPLADIDQAKQSFATRWVALKLEPVAGVAGMPTIEHDGLVQDEPTQRCLIDVRDVLGTAPADAYPMTLWLVPGVYRIDGERVRLGPGARTTLAVPAGTDDP
jgi:hypothetical protein